VISDAIVAIATPGIILNIPLAATLVIPCLISHYFIACLAAWFEETVNTVAAPSVAAGFIPESWVCI